MKNWQLDRYISQRNVKTSLDSEKLQVEFTKSVGIDKDAGIYFSVSAPTEDLATSWAQAICAMKKEKEETLLERLVEMRINLLSKIDESERLSKTIREQSLEIVRLKSTMSS